MRNKTGAQNKAYIEYFKIDKTNFRQKVRYFEQYITDIHEWNSLEKIDVELDYLLALFEIGKYDKYLNQVDHYLALVIKENIYQFQGKRIFEELLFKKAASLFNKSQFDEALTIQKQLVRIFPEENSYVNFLEKCLRATNPGRYLKNRNLALAFILGVVFLLVLEILLVRPFAPEYAETLEWTRNSILAIACAIYIYNELTIKRLVKKYLKK